MENLQLTDHRSFIEALVSRYIDARIEFVKSKDELGGKLGRSLWGSPSQIPLIQLPERITGQEIDESLVVLAMRGHVTGNPTLVQHADEIQTPIEYLKHLVLHEVAHVKNDWHQDRETDCDLWVHEQMHEET
jgi:hypothetical protein